ncbi:MAG TPA: dihydrofolate reductase family protein, partial [Gammaproteobacteria bacterium]|nr:dihydrofolate reductase family protein [Gammaproteobacteria bacterium]
ERFGPPAAPRGTFVYANYISSLDGRISLPDPQSARRTAPRGITNPRDWRLFQELAACADALLVSGSHVRDLRSGAFDASFPVSAKPEYEDLLRWRRTHGLAPQPAVVIVTATVDLPPLDALVESGRKVYVAAGEGADPRKIAAVQSQGAQALVAGGGSRVEGRKLIDALARESHRKIALISGGTLLHALIAADVLDRLYLTLACRLLGGLSFDTLLTGAELDQPARFKLDALHYDAETAEGDGVEQLFAILERVNGNRSRI